MISVDSYHTQKGVYTTNQIPTITERNAWHHGNVMETENETKLMVKPIETLPQPLMKNYQLLTTLPVPLTKCLRNPPQREIFLNEQTC